MGNPDGTMQQPSLEAEQVGRRVIEAAYAVHGALGPGLLELVYEQCLVHELELRGLKVRRQVCLPVAYKALRFDEGFRVDLLVDDAVIVEVKALATAAPIHQAKLLTYLKLSGFGLGLLVNFNVRLLKNGIHRILAQPGH